MVGKSGPGGGVDGAEAAAGTTCGREGADDDKAGVAGIGVPEHHHPQCLANALEVGVDASSKFSSFNTLLVNPWSGTDDR